MSRKLSVIAYALALAAAFPAGPADAGCISCRGGNSPGKGCGQLVTLKHPDLKGANRKKEFDKCMANPGGYNG